MKDIKNISVIVQSRLNSSRVPRKMIRPFAGTTLVDILLQKLSNSKVISPSQVYFCVGDEELIQIGKNYPVNIFERSEESLNEENNPKTQFEWRHSIPTDYIVMVSACNPLISIVGGLSLCSCISPVYLFFVINIYGQYTFSNSKSMIPL